MDESDTDDASRLPEWVEARFADERAYWSALRDGGAVSVEEGWAMVQRQWEIESQ